MSSLRVRLVVVVCLLLLALAGWGGIDPALAAGVPEDASRQGLLLLAPDSDLNSVVEAIRSSGGRAVHVFPPSALIGEIPSDVSLPAGARLIRRSVDEALLSTLDDEARQAALVWNALLAQTSSDDETGLGSQALEAELVGDAMVPPTDGRGIRALGSTGDPTPGYVETSEYLIGRVAVGIVLPESDGSVDASTEDWTEDERALVLSEITAALDWWAALEPRADLTFVYDDGTSAPIATAYEPISRPYNDQSLWIADVMRKMGYTSSSCFSQVRDYNNDLRDEYDTDWAFTIFVVDSSNDDDNRFEDGYFAYAYLGGPFTVMTYGNNGYGPRNMDAVAAHEIGHIFLALDQYYAAHQSCTRRSGYLGVENQNSQYGDCALDEPSIMRGQSWPYRDEAIDKYARGQIGWRDSDGDGILDPVDTELSVSGGDYTTDSERSNVLIFDGSVQDEPYPSPIRQDVLINTIERVQYRAAGSDWSDAQPTDGAFDTYAEEFTFTTSPLPTGEWEVELRVIDSAGNMLTETLADVSVVDPVDAILDTTLERMEVQAIDEEAEQVVYVGQGSSAASRIVGVYYRIDEEAWQPAEPDDGAFDESEESFSFSIDPATLSAGAHRVQAYSVDGEGNVETSPANDPIYVESRMQHVFLPLVMTRGRP